jgi:hypothetical protein
MGEPDLSTAEMIERKVLSALRRDGKPYNSPQLCREARRAARDFDRLWARGKTPVIEIRTVKGRHKITVTAKGAA